MDTCKINNIIIKKMDIADLNKISDILSSDFDDFWNYNIFKEELENNTSKYICAIYCNKIIGFAGIKICMDQADITNIVVKKNFRGNHIGKLLMKSLINIAISLNINTITLEVNEHNKIAYSLYKAFQFKECGQRKKYYYGTDTAIIMIKQLKEEV